MEEGGFVYGYELVERLNEEDERETVPRECEEIPFLTEEQERRIKETEAELGYRLVCYHAPSDAVMWGGKLLDELVEKGG